MSVYDTFRRNEAEKQRHGEIERQGREAVRQAAEQTRARTESERQAAERERVNNALFPKS